MKSRVALVSAFLAVAVIPPLPAAAEPHPLIGDKGLAGFKTQGADYWKFEEGVLVGKSDEQMKASILWTPAEYRDFTLTFSFRFSGDIDSGVFLRSENDQIQIGISRSLKRDLTGSPYIASLGKYPVEASGIAEILKNGEWNEMSIQAVGPRYLVSINQTQVLDCTSETAPESGPLGFQIHQGVEMKIEFKDIQIAEIKVDVPPAKEE